MDPSGRGLWAHGSPGNAARSTQKGPERPQDRRRAPRGRAGGPKPATEALRDDDTPKLLQVWRLGHELDGCAGTSVGAALTLDHEANHNRVIPRVEGR